MAGWNVKDVVGAAALLGVGLFFVIHGWSYPLGSATRMGPGAFPVVLGFVAIALSLLIFIAGMRVPARLSSIAWRPLAAIFGAILSFMLSIRTLGLVPAVVLTVCVAAFADRASRPLSTIVLATGLSAGAWLVFSKGLGMPVPAFRIPL